MGQFDGGVQINEKFNESVENPTDPLKDLKGETLKLNGGGLYPKFINPEEKEEIEEKQSFDTEEGQSEIFKENSEYLPILDRLKDTEAISLETYQKVVSEDLGNIDFNNIEGLDSEEKNILEGTFYNIKSSENNKDQNFTELKNDIKEISNTPELESFDLSVEDNNFSSEVLNKIGKNYLKFPDGNQKFDVTKDFSLAIVTTKIQILKEVKNIKTDSETYKVAIKNIDSKSIKEQLEGIESLYMLAYSNEGTLGKTTMDKYKNTKKKKLKNEAVKIDKQLNLETTQNNQVLLDELNKRKQEIIKEMSELTGIKDGKDIENGDIFKPTELDTVSNNTED